MAGRRSIALVLWLAVPLLLGAAASDRDLENIKRKITQERQGLSRLGAKETSTVQALGKIQQEIDKRNREIKQASARLSSIDRELRSKQARVEQLASAAAARLALLEERAAALYRWHRAGSPLVVFSGDLSLAQTMRRRRYLTAALHYDRALLQSLDRERREQHELEQQLAQRREEISLQRQIVGAAREDMRRQAQKQQVLLARVRQEKQTRLRALRQMEAAAQRLEKMLDQIARRALAKPPEPKSLPAPGAGLAALRGQLEWPVAGTVSAPFGRFKHPEFNTEIMRKGLEIETAMGAPVRAVEKGRVVYAEQFSGYGKMVIVEHGERYYTIYGHLAEIAKKNGDGVARGEIVGKAGDGESPGRAKLYFEMRKDGHSVDPLPWFAKR